MEKIAYTIKGTRMFGCGINKTYDLVNSKTKSQVGKKIMIPVNSINELIANTLSENEKHLMDEYKEYFNAYRS